MIVQTGTSYPLSLTVTRDGVGGVTGLAPTVAVRRLSDGFYLDWADGVFKNSGWTTLNGPMTDRGAGRYERSLSVTSTAGTVLLAEYTSTDNEDPLQTTETLLIVAAINDIPASVWADSNATTLASRVLLLYKLARNRLEQAAGNPGTLILYDDNGTTPLLTWQLRNSSGGAITIPASSPARRAAAT